MLTLGPVTSFSPTARRCTSRSAGTTRPARRCIAFVMRSSQPPLHRELAWPFVPHVTIADDASDEPHRSRRCERWATIGPPITCRAVHLLQEQRDD